MSVDIKTLNQYTVSHHNFEVKDWDNRPCTKDLYVLGKHKYLSPDPQHLEVDTTYESGNFKGLNVESIAEKFNTLFQKYKNCTVKGTNFQATAIYIYLDPGGKIPDQPFLFIAGIKIICEPKSLAKNWTID